jgi:hypothetical protein
MVIIKLITRGGKKMKYLLEYQTKEGWTKTYFKTAKEVNNALENNKANGEKFQQYRLWEKLHEIKEVN